MKKLLTLILLSCALCLWLTGCEEINKKLDAEAAFKHKLRKFNVKDSANPASGWYFVIAGGYTGASIEPKVRLYYQRMNGMYSFLEMPLDRVNIKIEDIEEPYLTSCRDEANFCTEITIHCREQDFQPDININQLK